MRAGAGHGWEQMLRRFCVINHGDRAAEARDDLLDGRESEVLVVLQIQFATPGIEQLDCRCPCRDLRLQIGYRCLSDAMQQLAEGFGLVVEETFYRGESFLGLAFHHVTGKSPRGPRKTQNGNLWTDGFRGIPEGTGPPGASSTRELAEGPPRGRREGITLFG